MALRTVDEWIAHLQKISDNGQGHHLVSRIIGDRLLTSDPDTPRPDYEFTRQRTRPEATTPRRSPLTGEPF